MGAVLAVVDERQQEVNRAGTARPHAGRELTRALHGAREGVRLLVRRRPCRFEEYVRPELALEQQLRRLTGVRNDGGQKVPARRALLAAMGQLLGQPSENQQIRLGVRGSHSGL
jgi:hypothetical protein